MKQKIIVSLGNANIPKELRPTIAKSVGEKIAGITPLPFITDSYTTEIYEWIDYVYSKCIAKNPQVLTNVQDGNSTDTPESSNQAFNTITDTRPGEVVDGVFIDNISHHTSTSLGPELLGYRAWKELKMSEGLRGAGFNERQIHTAALLVISRLVEPMSERSNAKSFILNSSLPKLMNFTIDNVGLEDRLYRVSDKLLQNSQHIETHLCKQQQLYFQFDSTIILYDLTNTHFEGSSTQNPKAKRGKNKQKRNDCPQIVVGMIFNNEGFSLGHKVFDGSTNDSVTLKTMLKEMNTLKDLQSQQLRLSFSSPLIIIDGGIATKANLKYLRDNDYTYLVNDSRRKRSNYSSEFISKKGFHSISTSDSKWTVDVKRQSEHHEKTKDEVAYDEAVLLCCSEGRRLKENAILSKAEERFILDLEKLKKRIETGQLKEEFKIHKAIGKVESKHSRVGRYYSITYDKSKSISWERNDKKYEEAHELFGCYVLRTNRLEFDSDTLWYLYMTLTKAEEGFKVLKHNLGLRPNYHQVEDRVIGHVFITIIAYHLLKFILYKLEKVDIFRSWHSIRRLLQTHCYATIKVPTKTGLLYTIHKAGVPDERQKVIYRSLGINWLNLPKKKEMVKMK